MPEPYCSPNKTLTFMDDPFYFSLILHILTVFSIPIHVFGAYCILFKTPPNMVSVKWSLLNLHFLTCLVDLQYYMSEAVIFIPLFSGFQAGILKYSSIPLSVCMYYFLVLILYLAVSIVGIFENRYHVLTENRFWRRVRGFWYLVNFAIASVCFYPVFKTVPKDQDKETEYVLQMIPCLHPDSKSAHLWTFSRDHSLFMKIEYCEITFIFLQGFLFTFLIIRWFRKFGTRLSGRTLEMQQKLIKALVFQMSLPLLIVVGPLCYCAVAIIKEYHNQALNNLSFIVISSHGMLSTVSLIMMHAPYRQELFRLFRKVKRSNESSALNSVNVLPASTEVLAARNNLNQ